MNKIKKTLLALFVAMSCSAMAQNAQNYLNIKAPISFDGKEYELGWSSHPADYYYMEEYFPEGQQPEHYDDMFTVSVVVADIKVADLVAAKLRELDERKKTDGCCNYKVLEREGGEFIIDFMVAAYEEGKTTLVESDIHHYKKIMVNGKPAVQLNFYSHRAYGDDIAPYFKTLAKRKADWIVKMGEMDIQVDLKQ
ncbi:MAG: hypothetical protein IKR18_06900 [Bacteroidaceae bacterium]|nr:hypothetical protein [Bacteroidaceae bacterium]